ncbi:MAG: hypothetical protein R3D25_18965 [Geminicoccaceae bacterium]
MLGHGGLHPQLLALSRLRAGLPLAAHHAERFSATPSLLRTISLVALAGVCLAILPNLFSLVVMAAGFSLNVAAYRALGTDRTYYSVELTALPPERVTAFPYSLTVRIRC